VRLSALLVQIDRERTGRGVDRLHVEPVGVVRVDVDRTVRRGARCAGAPTAPAAASRDEQRKRGPPQSDTKSRVRRAAASRTPTTEAPPAGRAASDRKAIPAMRVCRAIIRVLA